MSLKYIKIPNFKIEWTVIVYKFIILWNKKVWNVNITSESHSTVYTECPKNYRIVFFHMKFTNNNLQINNSATDRPAGTWCLPLHIVVAVLFPSCRGFDKDNEKQHNERERWTVSVRSWLIPEPVQLYMFRANARALWSHVYCTNKSRPLTNVSSSTFS